MSMLKSLALAAVVSLSVMPFAQAEGSGPATDNQFAFKSAPVLMAQAMSGSQVTLSTGNFVAAEHPISGAARVVTENGKRYVILDDAFKTDAGPALRVILHRSNQLPKGGLQAQDYVILGSLQRVTGTQRYAIPNNVNLANFRSVAIWCQQFNATFGYAPLGSAPVSIAPTSGSL